MADWPYFGVKWLVRRFFIFATDGTRIKHGKKPTEGNKGNEDQVLKMDRTTLPTVTNFSAVVHEDARLTVPYSPGLSVAGFVPFRHRKLQAKNEVSRARPPQMR